MNDFSYLLPEMFRLELLSLFCITCLFTVCALVSVYYIYRNYQVNLEILKTNKKDQ